MFMAMRSIAAPTTYLFNGERLFLNVVGFIGQCKLLWLVDTGIVRNVLSYECYTSVVNRCL